MLLCSSLPTQLAIGWTLRLAGWSPMNAEGELQLGFVTALTLLDTVALVGLMVVLMRARGERPAALWLGERPVPGEILKGIVHVPIVFSIGAVLLLSMRALTPQLHDVDVNPFEALAGNSLTDAAMLTLVAIVAGGVREELQRSVPARPLRAPSRPGVGRRDRAEHGVRAGPSAAGAGRRDRHRRDGRVLGSGLPAPAEQRGADGQPRAVQHDRSAADYGAGRQV